MYHVVMIFEAQCTIWVASPRGFSEKAIQPARHECRACCPLRVGFLAFQPVVDNTRGTHVEQVVSSFQKILRDSQLIWYIEPQKSIPQLPCIEWKQGSWVLWLTILLSCVNHGVCTVTKFGHSGRKTKKILSIRNRTLLWPKKKSISRSRKKKVFNKENFLIVSNSCRIL